MVAPPASKIPLAYGRVAAAEYVVDTPEDAPAVDHVQRSLQRVDHFSAQARVEVAYEHNGIPLLGMRCDELHHVVRSGIATAAATGVHGERSMVHHEEEGHGIAAVSKADPLSCAFPVPLIGTVLGHVLMALPQQVPGSMAVRHGQRVRSRDAHELALQTGLMQHAVHILALLEAHDIIRCPLVRFCDEPAGAPPGAPVAAEEIPPKQVVREDLDAQAAAPPATVEPPAVGRCLRRAPVTLAEDLPLWLPSNHGILHHTIGRVGRVGLVSRIRGVGRIGPIGAVHRPVG
mmetsp:Transcript_69336/g.178702  ORF Transcript_69336/g.178702 Transcript_69336/m.178702 type:complete len:289 (+) Transcript_69336:570-1436(+)